MAERMTWEEIVKKYPEQWVVLDDVRKDGATIISGIIVHTCSDEDIDSYFFETIKSGKRYTKRRTSDMRKHLVFYIHRNNYIQKASTRRSTCIPDEQRESGW